MTYTQIKYGEYEEAEQSVTLRANGGDCGGGSEVLVVQNIKEAYGIGNGQVNSIGMSLISNTLNCLDDQQKVMLSCVGGAETAQTLDASYYKGTGSRNGKEREIIAMNEGGEAMKSVVRRLTPLE